MQTQVTLGQRIRSIVGNSFGADIIEMNLEKAIQEARERADGPQSVFYDPLSMFMGNEWLSKQSQSLGFKDLRRMALNPIIGSIISTRINQIAAFCSPQQDAYQTGFRIVAADGSSAKDTARQKEITQWVYQVGIPDYGEDLLETFARKFMRDSLILDQACAEIVFRRNEEPAYMVCVDSATIRKLKASLEYFVPNEQEPFYCQVIDDQIKAEFTQDQMIFGVRNPQTDITMAGYGQSELEILIREVTTILNASKFNAGQLTSGGTAKGVLIVKGDAEKAQFESFKRDFREAVRNAATYWRPPVLQISKEGDVKWEQLDRSNRDMEYAALFDFLVKQSCGVYQMDPSEINWTIAATGTRTNFQSRENDKQTLSQKRGLKPLLNFMANQLNTRIISKIDPRYRLEFVGMDRDRKDDAEMRAKETQTYRTVNETRQELGLESLGPEGDIILSEYFAPKLTKPTDKATRFKDPTDANDVDIEEELN